MTDICNFEMEIRGSDKNIDLFEKALLGKGDALIGRGAYRVDIKKSDYKKHIIEGNCKSSMMSAFVHSAKIIRKAKEQGAWTGDDAMEILNIAMACEKYDVSFEAKSRSALFTEYLMCENGEYEYHKQDI